jgi:hypothetical protein
LSAHGSRRWGQPTARPFDALGAALLVAGPMAAVGRQRFPSAVLVAVLALTAVHMLRN